MLRAIIKVVLLLIVSVTLAKAVNLEEPITSQLLVTFANSNKAKFERVGGSGRLYRKRMRYQVGPGVRRNANRIARELGLEIIEDWPIKTLEIFCVVYEVSDPNRVENIIMRLRLDQRVESVQAMQEFRTLARKPSIYNDAYVNLQHGLVDMNIEKAHRVSEGHGVTIAVIDTAVDRHHEDIRHALDSNLSFVDPSLKRDNHFHGTAVASVISAKANNGKGMVGVAPGARLEILQACWSREPDAPAVCNTFTLAKALDYVVETEPAIINMSLAGPSDSLIARLVQKAMELGIVVVAATEQIEQRTFPADVAGVLAVSAAGKLPQPASTIISAPSEHIIVALPGNEYDFRSGSSLAAAHVSGAAALLLERKPEITAAGIRHALLVSQQSNERESSTFIDVCIALAAIDPTISCD